MSRTIDQELIVAVREGNQNLPEVRRLLRAGADVNAKDIYNGFTPLHYAADSGHVQVFQALREHGADIEATSVTGSTPLHFACDKGHLAVFIELLGPNDRDGTSTTSILGKRKSRGADIHAKDNEGDTPLHMASVDQRLHLASGGGHLAIVKTLLAVGADIFEANIDGRLPIHLAVHSRNSEVSKYLFQHLYATTRRLPLHDLLVDLTWMGKPIRSDIPTLREVLDENVLGTDDVVEIIEFLVAQNPALLSSRDPDGALPLHVACRHGVSFLIVQFLVDIYKASVKSVTSRGDVPLFLACEIPEPSLDTIFLLMKLYPELVYR
jgi:ankyrin repeat protein